MLSTPALTLFSGPNERVDVVARLGAWFWAKAGAAAPSCAATKPSAVAPSNFRLGSLISSDIDPLLTKLSPYPYDAECSSAASGFSLMVENTDGVRRKPADP